VEYLHTDDMAGMQIDAKRQLVLTSELAEVRDNVRRQKAGESLHVLQCVLQCVLQWVLQCMVQFEKPCGVLCLLQCVLWCV